jgi:hypothetical protein
MPEIETAAGTAPAPPQGPALEEWEVAAIGPDWRPTAGESELAPAQGRLALHDDALVFRADDVTDRATGAAVVAVIPAAAVTGAGPLSPGSRLTPATPAGQWMPAPLRRLRCPGFAVTTTAGTWVFDAPKGVKRAEAVRRRYAARR